MVKCCRRKIREWEGGLSVKTALGVLSKPNLMLRAAKILVCISVAAGHSHRRHRSHNPTADIDPIILTVSKSFSVRQSLRPLKKRKPVHKTSTPFYVHCPVQTIQEVPGEGRSTRQFLKIILQSYSTRECGPCLFCW